MPYLCIHLIIIRFDNESGSDNFFSKYAENKSISNKSNKSKFIEL
jgi:hypothetical protein